MLFINNAVEGDVINCTNNSLQRKCFVFTVVNKTCNRRTCLYIGGTILGITKLFK